MILHVSVILSTVGGGVSAPVHAGMHTPQPKVDPPDQRQAPPRPEAGRPPRAVHAGRYGQQAGGTHPTGMHTCNFNG